MKRIPVVKFLEVDIDTTSPKSPAEENQPGGMSMKGTSHI